jgi:small subunit ribosomal protein S20
MAYHKSSEKRIRQEVARKENNHYQGRTTRKAVQTLRSTTNKDEAAELLPKVVTMLDKQAKRNNIHKNKASNLKSSLTKYVNSL